jgi:hypothetical protein
VLTLTLVALVAAAPPPGPVEKPKLLMLDLVNGAGVDASSAGPISDAVASEIGKRGYFDVVSQRDVATLLGLERQKQLLGCSEASASCMTELSGALGARFVMSGSLAKLGDAYQLTLSTLDTQRAQPLGRSVRLARDLGTLQAQLPFAIAEATATPSPAPPSHLLAYTVIGVGAAGVVFGGVWGIVAISNESNLRNELTAGASGGLLAQTRKQYEGRASDIQTNKIVAVSALAAGAALVVVGVLINPADLPGGGSVALVPTGNGAALVGVFP